MVRQMKSYVISVSLGTGCYRHIQISAGATLNKLHKAILGAFGFEDDHAHLVLGVAQVVFEELEELYKQVERIAASE